MSDLIVDKLRERHSQINPLLFHRSLERAKGNGDLFDILDTIPEKYPIVWCEESSRWVSVKDLYLADEFDGEIA